MWVIEEMKRLKIGRIEDERSNERTEVPVFIELVFYQETVNPQNGFISARF